MKSSNGPTPASTTPVNDEPVHEILAEVEQQLRLLAPCEAMVTANFVSRIVRSAVSAQLGDAPCDSRGGAS